MFEKTNSTATGGESQSLTGQALWRAKLTGLENNVAKVRLTGACGSCPSAQFTIEDVVKSILKEALPELEDVVLDTSVSDELIDMAKKIMHKQV